MSNSQFENFYQFPTIEKLQELISSGKLKDSNIYDFLCDYSKYQEKQFGYDSPN